MSNSSISISNTITVAVGNYEPITLQVNGSEPAVIRIEVAGAACCRHSQATQPGSYTFSEPAPGNTARG